MTTIASSKDAFKSLLDDKSAKARILEFPKGHCWSTAIGFLQTADGHKSIFVKDRDNDESMIQEAISDLSQEFSKPFVKVLKPVVAPCYFIDRPSLESFQDGTPGQVLWNLKEEKWNAVEARKEQKESSEEKDDNHSDDDDQSEEERKPPPSDHDCWQLEEAVTYYTSSNDNATDSVDVAANSIDTSLRKKLRSAANRSGTGCLDLFTVLLLTQCAQNTIQTDPEWKLYMEYGLLDNPHDALTAAETHLLLNEKLKGTDLEVAVLFAAASTLPDVNVENVAIQEVSTNGEWRLRLLHFDTGVVPVSAGASLEPLKLLIDGSPSCDFVGEADCTGYFYPVLLSLPAVNQPISAATLEGLQKLDAGRLNTILSDKLSDSDSDVLVPGLDALGEFVQSRVEAMQQYALSNPNSALRDVVFCAVPAWKRDWETYCNDSESAEWIGNILEWSSETK